MFFNVPFWKLHLKFCSWAFHKRASEFTTAASIKSKEKERVKEIEKT